MGPGRVNFFWLGSGQPFMVWVRILKISPKNFKFFNFFPFGSKKIDSGRKVPGSKPGLLLIYCGSKVSSGRVGSGPISTKNQPVCKLSSSLMSASSMEGLGMDIPIDKMATRMNPGPHLIAILQKPLLLVSRFQLT